MKDTRRIVTRDNIAAVVQAGCIRGGDRGSASGALLRLLRGVYLPGLLAAGAWPDSVRRDFLGAAHRALAGLTQVGFRVLVKNGWQGFWMCAGIAVAEQHCW